MPNFQATNHVKECHFKHQKIWDVIGYRMLFVFSIVRNPRSVKWISSFQPKKSSMSDLRPLRVICPGLELLNDALQTPLCCAWLIQSFFRWRIDQRHGKKGSIIVEGFEDVHIQMIVDVWCSKCSNVDRLYVCICDIFVYYMHVIRSGMTLFDIIFIDIYTYGCIWASINKVLCCCLSIFRAPHDFTKQRFCQMIHGS